MDEWAILLLLNCLESAGDLTIRFEAVIMHAETTVHRVTVYKTLGEMNNQTISFSNS
jgi:hypothetical protein